MKQKEEKINAKLKQYGQMLGLDEVQSIKAKRTTRNILSMAILTGALIILGNLMMPGGPVGLYYTGGSIKDFKMLFGGFI